jgi:methyl-accepting chemotaxis protein
MRQPLTITHRLILVSLIVSLPLVAITVFLVVTAVNKDINFSRWEKMGNEYQRPLERLLDLLPRHDALVRHALGHDASADVQRVVVASEIDAAFNALSQVQNEFGVALQFTPQGLAQRKREHVLPANVANEWRDLVAGGAQLTATSVTERHVHLISDVRTMITHAGDTSNLILDPDLDSYYLMDATLVALPQNQDRLATIAAYAEAIAPGVPLTPAHRTQFAVYAALLKEADIDRIDADVQTALNEDANFYGRSPSLQSDLPPALKNYDDAVAGLLEVVTQSTTDSASFNAQAFSVAATKAREASFHLWSTAAKELDVLLDKRIQHYEKSRAVSLGLTALAMAFASATVFFMIRSLKRTLAGLTVTLGDGADQVAATANQVSASSQTLADGASEQAASLEETSAALEEVSSMTKRNADGAVQARGLAAQTRAAADAGAADMEEMKRAMDAIAVSSSGISKIIKTIDEIAFQTNILALNAAVEAARAGEAGMGFAVVADEVRSLAQRSAQSARETADKIEEAIHKSEDGVRISGKVALSLSEIVEKARKVDALVAEIATASTEQNQGLSQVNVAVRQMDQLVQSNAANAEETAAAAEALSSQSVTTRNNLAQLLILIGGAHDSTRPNQPAVIAGGKPTSVHRRSSPSPTPAVPSSHPQR